MRCAWPVLVLLAGCASTPPAGRPESVVVRLQEDAAQADLNRPIVARLFGEERRSLGRMMEELVTEELVRRGVEVRECAEAGATPEGLAASLRESGSADGIVWIRVGRWDLGAVASGGDRRGYVSRFTGRPTPGGVNLARPRAQSAQAGEQRDIRGFIHRLVIEGLRDFVGVRGHDRAAPAEPRGQVAYGMAECHTIRTRSSGSGCRVHEVAVVRLFVRSELRVPDRVPARAARGGGKRIRERPAGGSRRPQNDRRAVPRRRFRPLPGRARRVRLRSGRPRILPRPADDRADPAEAAGWSRHRHQLGRI